MPPMIPVAPTPINTQMNAGLVAVHNMMNFMFFMLSRFMTLVAWVGQGKKKNE
jgi:phosphoribosylcarboxyaminoimidazole (NCAIR) mutase